MTDELHGHAGIAIDLFLERKNHEHTVGNPLHHLHAALAPRPQLRADVINDGHPEFLHGGCEAEIEIGEVDDDERLRLFGARRVDEPVEDGERFWQHPDRLDKTCDAQASVIRDQLAATGHEALAAESENGGVGLAAPYFDCEGAGV